MTISTETNKIIYSGLIGQDTFAYNFRVDEKGHMEVYLDGAIIPDGDWTIDGLGNASGGNVTLNTPLVADVSVTLLRNVDSTQLVDYQPFDAFPAETHESALDKLTMIVQQLQEQLTRVPILPPDSPLTDFQIGTPEPNNVVQYNAAGDGIESSGIDATQFNANVQAAADSAAAALESENKANQWAEEAEDVEVKPGQFSAFHWAMKSQAFTDWEKYLDGYDPTSSRHERYMGTLDAIDVNSKYFIDSTEIIGGPVDFTGLGVIETNLWDTDTNQAVQLLVSMDVANDGAAWIRNREAGAWGVWKPFGAGGAPWMEETVPAPPAGSKEGDRWWDPEIGRAYVYYDDGDSQQWVEEDPNALISNSPGTVVQVESFEDGAFATGTGGVIPADNTIPQITEGSQFLSLNFTPKFASSKLQIEVILNLSHSSSAARPFMIASVFRDGAADAIGVGAYRKADNAAYELNQVVARFTVPAASTSQSTFTVRGGSDIAGNIYHCGVLGSPLFLGSYPSSITITEIAQ